MGDQEAKSHQKLYEQLMEKNWNETYFLSAVVPDRRQYVNKIELKGDLRGLLDYLKDEGVDRFRLGGFVKWRSDKDYVKVQMNFERDQQTGFWLDRLELSNQHAKLLTMSIPYGNYLPERNGLLERFEKQQQLKKPLVILPKKSFRNIMGKGGQSELQP